MVIVSNEVRTLSIGLDFGHIRHIFGFRRAYWSDIWIYENKIGQKYIQKYYGVGITMHKMGADAHPKWPKAIVLGAAVPNNFFNFLVFYFFLFFIFYKLLMTTNLQI